MLIRMLRLLSTKGPEKNTQLELLCRRGKATDVAGNTNILLLRIFVEARNFHDLLHPITIVTLGSTARRSMGILIATTVVASVQNDGTDP